MNKTLYVIGMFELSLSLIPLGLVLGVYWFWSMRTGVALYATARMLLQLLVVGFFLNFVFESRNPLLISFLLLGMLAIASWIALRPVVSFRTQRLWKTFLCLAVVNLSVLALILFAVIRPTPWYQPTYLIPMAGMIFANSMNTLSLAAERFERELSRGEDVKKSRAVALEASLIPLTNSFLAVGLVSLPGMMTGQILAGVDPLIAARYQILIMATVFGSGGLSAALYLLSFSKEAYAKSSV